MMKQTMIVVMLELKLKMGKKLERAGKELKARSHVKVPSVKVKPILSNVGSTCQREFWSLTIKGKQLLDVTIQMN